MQWNAGKEPSHDIILYPIIITVNATGPEDFYSGTREGKRHLWEQVPRKYRVRLGRALPSDRN
jgi:hypothetical protein